MITESIRDRTPKIDRIARSLQSNRALQIHRAVQAAGQQKVTLK
jgi:hypothetical protein